MIYGTVSSKIVIIASNSVYGEAVIISLARIKLENVHVVCSTVSP